MNEISSYFEPKMDIITPFRGEYFFLSNLFPCNVKYKGHVYPSVEHAFQAAKCELKKDAKLIQTAKKPKIAKSLGRRIKMRSDWEAVKKKIMYELLMEKFKSQNLQKLLRDTKSTELVKFNIWHDKYWGVCTCVKCGSSGANVLGQLLMRVRQDIILKEYGEAQE